MPAHSLPEEFRPVPGYPGYEVSNRGRVRSYWTNYGRVAETPRLLKPTLRGAKNKHYLTVPLAGGPKPKRVGVAALVALAFIGPRPPGAWVLHHDDDQFNNDLSNLRYGTAKENRADARANGRLAIGSMNGRAKLDEAAVAYIKQRLDLGDSLRTLAREYGVNRSTIHRIRCGKRWRHVAFE